MTEDAETPLVPRNALKPYASLIVLICLERADPESLFSQIESKLQTIRKATNSRPSIQVVAEDFPGGSSSRSDDVLNQFDQFSVAVQRVESRPSWLKEPLFTDVYHELIVAFRRGKLIALHLPSGIRDAFQSWLDKPPRPMVRRIAGEVFERALLTGESRGLWLRGTHSRRKTKADSKSIIGSDVRQTLSAVEDQTYTLNSARSVLPTAPTRIALTGTVGTTPTRSLVWNKATDDFDEFAQCAYELLELLAETISADAPESPVFALLTQPVFDFANVWGAYDISCASPLDLPDSTDEAKRDAASTLEEAFLLVTGRDDSADFELDVGQDMRIGGKMRGRVRLHDDSARLTIGLAAEPRDPTIVLPVRDALQHTDLLTVYYGNHSGSSGVILRRVGT